MTAATSHPLAEAIARAIAATELTSACYETGTEEQADAAADLEWEARLALAREFALIGVPPQFLSRLGEVLL